MENVFGILANRFRVFLSPTNLTPRKAETIVLTCTALHNFLRRDHVSHYTPAGSLDVENLSVGRIAHGDWRQIPQLLGLQRVGRNASGDARNVRDQYMEYFTAEGAVPWQYRMTK